MALAGTPARYNKVIVVKNCQYGPTFAKAHGGIQYDCGSGLFPTLPNIYLFGSI
jgi:hypothetical protein